MCNYVTDWLTEYSEITSQTRRPCGSSFHARKIQGTQIFYTFMTLRRLKWRWQCWIWRWNKACITNLQSINYLFFSEFYSGEFQMIFHRHKNSLSTSIIFQWLISLFTKSANCVFPHPLHYQSLPLWTQQSNINDQSRSTELSDHTDNNLKTLCHAIPLLFIKIYCVAFDGLHVVKSILFLCLIKQRVL
jgi:hypothetical protein